MTHFHKTAIIIFMMVLASNHLFSQNTSKIKGIIIDSTSYEPVPYATVCLYDTAHIFQNGAISGEDGVFYMNDIQFNRYIIEVTYVGYRKKKFELNIKEKDFSMRVRIAQDNTLLESVNIVGEKIKRREEIDKSVYTINKSLLQNAPTAYDILQKLPTVSVDKSDEKIRVKGSRNVLVLIDGSYTKRNINSINPEDIESIEVITNPSSEFDSDVANVINIVLKQERKKGLRLVALGSASYPNEFQLWRVMADFEFSKFRLFANYYICNSYIYPENTIYDSSYYSTYDNIGNEYLEIGSSKLNKRSIFQTQDFQYGFDYRIGKNDFLNFTGSTGKVKDDYSGVYREKYLINNNLEYEEVMNYQKNNSSPEQNYTLFYRHKFAKKSHELTLNTNLYVIEGNEIYKAKSVFTDSDEDQYFNSLKRDVYNSQKIWNTKLKYDLPVNEKLKFSTGIQTYFRDISYHYDDSITNQYFEYQDIRIAGFLQTIFKFNEKISLSAGLRCENLRFNIYDTISNKQMNYLPNTTFMYKISKYNYLKINYKALLNYPSYHFLSPFIYSSTDSLMFSSGNPNLLPEKSHNISLEYLFENESVYFSVEPYITFRKGLIGENRVIDGSLTKIVYDNMEDSEKYGGKIGTSVIIADVFTPEAYFNIGYATFEHERYNGWEYSVEAGFELELPWDMAMTAMFYYDAKTFYFNGYEWQSPMLDEISIEKEFLKNKLNITLSANNLFLVTRASLYCIAMIMNLLVNTK